MKKKVIKFLKIVFLCKLFNDHDWTSNAQKGIPPTEFQKFSGVNGFKDYAKMYCDRCGHVSELSLKGRSNEKRRDAVKYINEAANNPERFKRKSEMFGILYGSSEPITQL